MTIKHHSLANGFRVVTEHMPGLQSASIGIWVNVGGRDESAAQNGIAHFLEHMAFKGTPQRSALQIAETIENVGGYINAYTSRETTAFYARVLQNDVALALDVLGDILLNPLFDAREIETERGVILQEIGQALDTPDDVIFDWLQDRAYPEQSLGRSILGPAELVACFDRTDLLNFVAENYGPEQMILAAAGAVDHDAICAQAEALFAHMVPRRKAAPAPARFVGGETRRVKDLEQAHLALAFEGPSYKDQRFYAAQIYAVALGGGMSSRLFQEIREKRGLCYSIFSHAGAYLDTGMLNIYAGTSGAQMGDLMRVTFDELHRVVDDLAHSEIDRARAQMKAGLLMGLEGASSRAERLARMTQIWGRVPDLSDTVARIDAVSHDDVVTFAQDIASQAAIAMALYGPIEAVPYLAELKERRAA